MKKLCTIETAILKIVISTGDKAISALDEVIKYNKVVDVKLGSEDQFSLRNDNRGGKYWQVETEKDIFKGLTSTKDLKKAAYDFILHGEKGEQVNTVIDGEPLTFTRVGAKEYIYGSLAKGLESDLYNKKMRLAPSIIDLIDNANVSYDNPDHKSHMFAKKGFKNYKGKVRIDNVFFNYIVIVGKGDKDNMFYDINLEVDVKVPDAKDSASLIKVSTSNANIAQGNKDVNSLSSKNNISTKEKHDEKMFEALINNLVVDRGLKFEFFDDVVDSGKPNFSLDELGDMGTFDSQVDSVLDNNADFKHSHLYLGETPSIYEDFGLDINKAILVTANHIKTMNAVSEKKHDHKHGLSREVIKALPKAIANPTMVMISNSRPNDSLVVVTNLLDSENRPIIASILANGEGNYNEISIEANIMTSSYGRSGFNNFLDVAYKENRMLYVDKEKSQQLMQTPGVQFPNNLQTDDLSNNILLFKEKVNSNSKNIASENATENVKPKYPTAKYSGKANVNACYNRDKKTIYMSRKGRKNLIALLGHELFHTLTKEQQAQLVAFFRSAGNTTSPEFLEYRARLTEIYSEMYSKDGREFTDTDFWNEWAAENCSTLFTNKDYINRLASKNKSLANRILNFIRRVFNSLSGRVYTKSEATEVAKITAKDLAIAEALGVKSRKFNADVVSANTELGMYFDRNGDPKMAIISDDIFNGHEDEKRHKVIKNHIKSNIDKYYTIMESGQRIYIGKDLPGEYTFSKATQGLDTDMKKVKGQLAQGFEDMIAIATNRSWEANKKDIHEKQAKYGWYKYYSKVGIKSKEGISTYDVSLIIRNDENGKKYLYDVMGIKEREFATYLPPIPRSDIKFTNSLLDDSIQQDEDIVNSNLEDILINWADNAGYDDVNFSLDDARIAKIRSDFDRDNVTIKGNSLETRVKENKGGILKGTRTFTRSQYYRHEIIAKMDNRADTGKGNFGINAKITKNYIKTIDKCLFRV